MGDALGALATPEAIEIGAICLLAICCAGLFWSLSDASNDSDIDGDAP
jgi:hypothetical protein